jgi:anti-sigma factor RsiW
MTTPTPVTEEELHAYLDGELGDTRRAVVEAYLREHPDDARRLEAYRADGAAVGRIFSHVPAAMPAKRSAGAPRRRSVSAISWRLAAAAVLILSLGGAGGWFGRALVNDASMERLAQQAAAAHLILEGPGAEPLETSSLEDLSRIISRALGVPTELRDPSSTGYKIAGARVVPQAKGRGVQLVMRGPADETITFYFEGRPGAKETPFRRIAGDGVTTLVWEDDDRGCAMTSTLEPKKLEEVGRRIYEALLG